VSTLCFPTFEVVLSRKVDAKGTCKHVFLTELETAWGFKAA